MKPILTPQKNPQEFQKAKNILFYNLEKGEPSTPSGSKMKNQERQMILRFQNSGLTYEHINFKNVTNTTPNHSKPIGKLK